MENTQEYRGYTITLLDNWTFLTIVDGETKHADSVRELEVFIDEHVKRQDKIGRRKLEFAAIDSNGINHTVTGLHASREEVLMTPKQDNWNVSVYVKVPWIEVAMKERLALVDRAADIKAALEPFRITRLSPTMGGSSETIDQFEERLKILKGRAVAEPLDLANVPRRKKL